MNELTFVFNIEPYTFSMPYDENKVLEKDSQRMSIMLCKSIKALHPDANILAISSNGKIPDSKTLKAYKDLGVTFDKRTLNTNPFNGYFNKVYAYQYMSNKVTTPYICFLDLDMLLLKELDFESIKTQLESYDLVSALGFEPKPVLSEGQDQAPVYKRFFLTEEQETYMGETYGLTKDNLYHSGIMFFKNDSKFKTLMNDWLAQTDIMVNDENIARLYSKGAFVNNAFTDEDTLTPVLADKKVITLPVEELVHYHLFQGLVYAFKDMVIPEHIMIILRAYDFPHLDKL